MTKLPFKYYYPLCRFALFIAGSVLLLASQSLLSQTIHSEARAVWLTTVDNLDWPKETDIGNTEAQKKSLIGILNKLQSMNFNTIYFQVRPRGNAFYNSSIEPWAKELSGKLGINPGWDPLRFITEEANKRGMEVHAWINVVKLWSGKFLPPKSYCNHVVRSNNKWCKLYENEWWLDLGYPDARSYTLRIIKDILTNYNIDGLHFDYLRYPGRNFNDKESYSLYGNNSNKDDWRRDNINLFLKDVKKLVSETKPYMKIGVAPIGIYKNIPGVTGWSSYESLFQDTKYWLDNDLVDYIAPQTYWDTKLTRRDPAFGLVIKDWNKLSNGKNIYPGIGLWKKSISDEISRQIEICRAENMRGFSIYRYSNILNNQTLENLFTSPVLIPKSKNHKENFSKNDIVLNYNENKKEIYWSYERTDIKFFNIYRISGDEKKLVKITGRNTKNFLIPNNASVSFALSFTTLYDNESPLFYPTKTIIAENLSNEHQKTSTNIFDNKTESFNLPDLFNSSIYLACHPIIFKEYVLVGYEINQKLPVELTISTVTGKEILKLLKGIQNKGKYILKADGSDFEKGKYICTLRAGDTIKQKIIIKK